MSYDRLAPKRPVDVSLNDGLVRQVERERARRRDEDLALVRVMDEFGAFHREHGLLSDEFSSI